MLLTQVGDLLGLIHASLVALGTCEHLGVGLLESTVLGEHAGRLEVVHHQGHLPFKCLFPFRILSGPVRSSLHRTIRILSFH